MKNKIINFNGSLCLVVKTHKGLHYYADLAPQLDKYYPNGISVIEILNKNKKLFINRDSFLGKFVTYNGNIPLIHPKSKLSGFIEINDGICSVYYILSKSNKLKCHREDGPACIWPNEPNEFYVNGEFCESFKYKSSLENFLSKVRENA